MKLKEITEDDIYVLVGHTSTGRGYDDYESGMVKNLKVRGTTIDAEVAGRLCPSYTVKVWCDDDGIDGNCTCPYSQGVDVCQHVAAVLFAWIYERVDETPSSAIGELQLRQGLENLSKPELAELLMEVVRDNDALYQKLRALVESIGDVRRNRWKGRL